MESERTCADWTAWKGLHMFWRLGQSDCEIFFADLVYCHFNTITYELFFASVHFPQSCKSLRRTHSLFCLWLKQNANGANWMCLKTCNQLTISTFGYHANMLHTSRNFISFFRGHLKAPAQKSRDIQAMELIQYLGKLDTLHMKPIWIVTFRFLQLAFKISIKCLSLYLSILNNIPSTSCLFVATSFIDRVGGLVPGAHIGVMGSL